MPGWGVCGSSEILSLSLGRKGNELGLLDSKRDCVPLPEPPSIGRREELLPCLPHGAAVPLISVKEL